VLLVRACIQASLLACRLTSQVAVRDVLRGPRNFRITMGDGTVLTCEDAVKKLLKGKRRWEIRSAGTVHGATADDDAEEPSSYPVATAGIAAEIQRRMREAAQRRGRRPGPRQKAVNRLTGEPPEAGTHA
jgi:hypothetical protein